MKTLGTQVRPEAVERRITTTWARSGTPRGAIRQIAVQDPFDPFPSVAESRPGADAGLPQTARMVAVSDMECAQ